MNEDKKQVINKLKGSKLLVSLVIGTFLFSLISAGYLWGYFGIFSGNIIGAGEVVAVISEPTDFSFDMSTGGTQSAKRLELENLNGDMDVAFTTNITSVLTEVGCPFDEAVAELEMVLNRENLDIVAEGEVFNFPTGTENFWVTLKPINGLNPCGQDVTITISLDPAI